MSLGCRNVRWFKWAITNHGWGKVIYPFYAFDLLHVFFQKECLARGITQPSRISQETISTHTCNILSATGAGILFNWCLLCGIKLSKKYKLQPVRTSMHTYNLCLIGNETNLGFYSAFPRITQVGEDLPVCHHFVHYGTVKQIANWAAWVALEVNTISSVK